MGKRGAVLIANEKWLKEVTEAPGKSLQRLLETWPRANPEEQGYLLEAILRQQERTQITSPKFFEILKSVVQDPPKLFSQDNPEKVLEAYLSNPLVMDDEAKSVLVNLENSHNRVWDELLISIDADLLPEVNFSIRYRIERVLDTDVLEEVAAGYVSQSGEVSESLSSWTLSLKGLFDKLREEEWGRFVRDAVTPRWLSEESIGLELDSRKSSDEASLRRVSEALFNLRNQINYYHVEEAPENVPESDWDRYVEERYVEESGGWLVTLNLRDYRGGQRYSSDPYLKAVLSWAHEAGAL